MAVRFIPGQPPRGGRLVLPATLLGLTLAITLPELLLQAADHGLIGSARWRPLAYQYGAFWAGLLHGWRPNYAAQPWTMFLSYAFLHGGIGHLAGNIMVLVPFGARLGTRVGTLRLMLIYFLSAIAGGIAFGLMSQSPQPMVGASGALFGLVGGLLTDEIRQRRLDRLPVRPVAVLIAVLVALNVVVWFATDGLLAWQTHLGGFLGGAAVLLLTRRR